MGSIFIIFKKEMKDLLRDRRTIMAMMVLPLVLVPVILTITGRIALSVDDPDSFKDIRVAIQTNGNGADLMERFFKRKTFKADNNLVNDDKKLLLRL